ncbi:DUF2798 domain-containing protein [Mitsuaria sp. WAJ17]|uniref:DUF2798 domain-containing protein n=1 Tax=Mitsuaria sp. WAJ17 TaxID=2761452 RepID=UPI001603A41C|nr:DUF2798 domain-containing protein [Mitsuaria sp. WAJ17]MBB2483617.1 DUF2798 domain-containing protein [Mitsuaria sp. WAJ17]
MIPPRFAGLLFALILSGLMSALVAGIASWGASAATLQDPWPWLAAWRRAWLHAWPVAFPAVLLMAPLTRRLVAWLTTPR